MQQGETQGTPHCAIPLWLSLLSLLQTVQDLLGASVKELKVRELENGEVRTTGNAVKKVRQC